MPLARTGLASTPAVNGPTPRPNVKTDFGSASIESLLRVPAMCHWMLRSAPRLALMALPLLVLLGCTQPAREESAASNNDRATAAASPAALTADPDLRQRLDRVIENTRRRRLSPQVNNAWHIVHGILAYGRELEIHDNDQLVPALDWLLGGGKLKGWNLVPGEKGLEGVLEPGTKSGQGHEDQWLGYLSQAGLGLDDPLLVQGETFKVADLVTQAQWDIHEGQEATWTLMALGTLLPLDAKWNAKDGSEWTLERIIAMESAQELNSSACGGSHRLYGITATLKRYRESGDPLTGGWLAAAEKVAQAVAAARQFQQPDGGFSTKFFDRSATSADIGLRINTTGHVLEFLMLALDDKQFQEPWVHRAAHYLLDMLEATEDAPLECGGLYHAAHALKLYRQRRFDNPRVAGVRPNG